ncbi:MAG: sigma-70 family RNA polymerase sigma factor [Nannocystaceae bacterium]|nr:sigma-70 family RNA polymerase sigma factor [Nannocystaceae bacterium]
MTAEPTEVQWQAMEDAQVVLLAAKGKVKALATLYDRYAGLLLTMANKLLGDRAMAEDLVQDVFMEVWRRASSFDASRGSVRTWLLVRLRSRALDRLRSASHRREVAVADVTPHHTAASEGDDPTLAPDRKAVVAALSQLPKDQRVVIELSYFQGMSASEIAAKVGSPIGTVKSRTAAALGKLRTAMAETPRPPPNKHASLSGGPQ